MVTEEEETEVELELGLSIGGNYRKPNGDVWRSETSDRIETSCFVRDTVQELDQRTKREIHAMRRQEAKKKRELKKGFSCKDYSLNTNNVKTNVDGKINNEEWLKGKDFQVSNNSDERESKKSKTEGVRFDGDNDNGGFYFRPVPLHYGLPGNGFVYPCWFTGGVAVAEDKIVGPVVGCGFVPFQARGYNLGNGHDSEPSWSVDGSGNRKVGSNNGSPLCTSSAGSDRCWSSSHEGGSSSYTRSRSSPSFAEQSHWHGLKATETKGLSDHTATSQLKERDPVNESPNRLGTTTQANNEQSSPTRLKEEAKLETEKIPTEKDLSAPENPAYTPLTEGKVHVGKPPKPQSQNQNSPSLPYMPCVSATGDGPNGKTINGFLYRYTKAEVSIICVCHGRSFSPAEFVQHAGGTDVSHPLRHITVIPSAF